MNVMLDNGASHDDHSLPRLRILAVNSVSPPMVTEPRLARKVLLASSNDLSRTIGGCYQVVLYYNNDNDNNNDEESDWSFYGWIVESLAKVLARALLFRVTTAYHPPLPPLPSRAVTAVTAAVVSCSRIPQYSCN
ncbi:hypothetical protein PIB30_062976 [Stylosanthes scabra]|uniref:Uncharacterized protein n=1 Tax=Stylosanthes scabra TaxID=79078 RepID=A0ABU6YLZ4_9FABA|nr:hypothetical protein [Stylosanthes scabra]